VIADIAPMAPDEAYYWVWSKALAPGYLDHPPMVALWIRLGTEIAGDGNLGVRLLAPFSAVLGSWMLLRAGDDLLPGRNAGLWAAALLNATLIAAVGATTMTPDTPLLLFWTMTLWALARLHATGKPRWWLVAGLAAGLALDSKYTAVLLAPVILTWLLLAPSMRTWLGRPYPWLAALVALAMFSPVLLWNAQHGWVSFAKQGARAADWHPGRALQFLGELIGGQIGLATPLIALVAGAGIVLAARRAITQNAAWVLLASFTLIPAAVFAQHALGDRVQANWPSIIYPAAAIAATSLTGMLRRLFVPAVALGGALVAIVWVQAIWTPVALPMRLDPTLLRLGGWQTLADDIETAARQQNASFIAFDNYGQAALFARLLPPTETVLGAEGRWSLFNLPDGTPPTLGRPGLLVRSARRDDRPDPGPWAEIAPLAPLTRARAGMTAETFRLYRVVGHASDFTIKAMPHPGE
jgi:4-amino-4-deoxy-L-arabinose transferase-like glycosyltransferase